MRVDRFDRMAANRNDDFPSRDVERNVTFCDPVRHGLGKPARFEVFIDWFIE